MQAVVEVFSFWAGAADMGGYGRVGVGSVLGILGFKALMRTKG